MDLSDLTRQASSNHEQGNLKEAERLCRLILSHEPQHFEALHVLGIIAAQSGRFPQAAEALSRAVAVTPKQAAAHANLGRVLHQLKRHSDALKHFEQAIAISPARADFLLSRADVFQELNCLEDALNDCEQALQINANDADAHYFKSIILGRLARYAEVLKSCEKALRIRPDFPEAMNNRGNALRQLGQRDEALKSYTLALKIRPDYPEALSNRAALFRELGRPNEALADCDHALRIHGNFADAIYNRGIVLGELNRPGEAVECYTRVLAIHPHDVKANWNLALCQLQLGNFERGWAGYEWRWKEDQLAFGQRVYPQPLWLGKEQLRGKTILLHAEAGFGDTLQFCRYAQPVANLGARVLLEVQPELHQLLSGLSGATQVLATGQDLPPFDYHCPLMSLPLALGTRLETIPADFPYIQSDRVKVAYWARKLGSKTKPRVGLVWRGNPKHRNDHNRSLALADLVPALDDDTEWISLQKDVPASDRDTLDANPRIRHLGDCISDFADTAALIELMDLVISVDTSVAHLAGGMGKRLWLLLPFSAEWRWLMNRDDSPWYPTAQLFRQTAIGDWAGAIAKLRSSWILLRVEIAFTVSTPGKETGESAIAPDADPGAGPKISSAAELPLVTGQKLNDSARLYKRFIFIAAAAIAGLLGWLTFK